MLSNIFLTFCQVHVVENLVVELISLDLFLAFSWWWCSACYTYKDWLKFITLKAQSFQIFYVLCCHIDMFHSSVLILWLWKLFNMISQTNYVFCLLWSILFINLVVLIFIWIFECLIYSNVCRLKHVLTVACMLFKFFSCW